MEIVIFINICKCKTVGVTKTIAERTVLFHTQVINSVLILLLLHSALLTSCSSRTVPSDIVNIIDVTGQTMEQLVIDPEPEIMQGAWQPLKHSDNPHNCYSMIKYFVVLSAFKDHDYCGSRYFLAVQLQIQCYSFELSFVLTFLCQTP